MLIFCRIVIAEVGKPFRKYTPQIPHFSKPAALAHHVNVTRHAKEQKFKHTDSGTAKCSNSPKRCTDDNSRASMRLKASPAQVYGLFFATWGGGGGGRGGWRSTICPRNFCKLLKFLQNSRKETRADATTQAVPAYKNSSIQFFRDNTCQV